MYFWKIPSPLGTLTLASDGDNLTGLWIENQKYYGSTLSADAEEKWIPVFEQTTDWLKLYFEGKEPDFCPPLKPQGSEFRQRVWKILLEIPRGETITYGKIAERVARESGKNASAQAVGGAVAHNPISILIPCHRVMGTDGSLTGYAGGLDKKSFLLQLERAAIGLTIRTRCN